MAEESEDHLHVENTARTMHLLYFGIMFVLTYIIFYFLLPKRLMTQGIVEFPPTYLIKVTRLAYANSAVVGLIFAFLICILTEYFTSMSGLPAQSVEKFCALGLPLNIVRAQAFS